MPPRVTLKAIAEAAKVSLEEAGLEPTMLESDSSDEREFGYLAAKRLLSQRGAVSASLLPGGIP